MFEVERKAARKRWIENYDGEDGSSIERLRVGVPPTITHVSYQAPESITTPQPSMQSIYSKNAPQQILTDEPNSIQQVYIIS